VSLDDEGSGDRAPEGRLQGIPGDEETGEEPAAERVPGAGRVDRPDGHRGHLPEGVPRAVEQEAAPPPELDRDRTGSPRGERPQRAGQVGEAPDRLDLLVAGEKGVHPGEEFGVAVQTGVEERLRPDVEGDDRGGRDLPDRADGGSLGGGQRGRHVEPRRPPVGSGQRAALRVHLGDRGRGQLRELLLPRFVLFEQPETEAAVRTDGDARRVDPALLDASQVARRVVAAGAGVDPDRKPPDPGADRGIEGAASQRVADHVVVVEDEVVEGQVPGCHNVDHGPHRQARCPRPTIRTARMIKAPLASGWANGLTPIRFRALLRMPMIRAPIKVPTTPP